MRFSVLAMIVFLLCNRLQAQENNPLINSGELIEKAIALHDKEKYQEAIEIYKTIPRGDTNYARVLYEMAYSQMQDSQFVAARQTCEKGLAFPNERWADFYTLYGNITDDLGDSQKALAIYDTAIRLYPAYSDLYLNKATTYIKLEKYAEAENILKQCLMINPYQASAHYKIGACALAQGRPVQAALSFINYLLLAPSGRYYSNCITSLSLISKAGEDLKDLISKRTEDLGDNFATIERIILSKMALDKQYKPLLKVDDVITRQIQVIFEKLQYDENDQDFWMQYYVPLFFRIFDDKKFEPFANRLFSNLKIESIQDYMKKNKKELDEVVNMVVEYCNQIRFTRELKYSVRISMDARYHYDNGRLFGKGATMNNGEKLTGPWEFYFSPGNIRSKGNYDENGERTGPWQYYFFNGQLKGKQNYKAGKLDGEEIYYHETGALSTVANYKNGDEDGTSKSYYLIGIPRVVTNYKSSKQNGERLVYFSNGTLQAIENYKDDSLHGPFKTYYKTGPLESEGTYDNGKLNGTYRSYYENGKVSLEGPYVNGEPHGNWKQFHENGKLKFTKNFVNGLAEGDYVEYHDNGQVFYKCVFKKGKITGDVEYSDDDGKKYFVYSLDNDIAKTAVYYDKTGKEVGRSERKSKRLDLTTYYPDGYKRSQAVYNDKGEINGEETFYFRSGKISTHSTYEDGKQTGESLSYYQNGKLHHSVSYEDGEKHGYEKYFFIHGQVEDEGWYQEGVMQGIWLSHNELGDLVHRSEYLNGDLNGYKEEFYPNGKKANETRYKLGWIEEFIQFDTTGKEISRSIIKNGNGKFKVVFENGKTYGEGAYVDGELNGSYRFYFFDGKVNTQQYYKRGDLDSTFRNYYYGGQLATEGQYKYGQKDGIWKVYFSTGKLNYVEKYENGEQTGKKIYYFENGKTDTEIEFENGIRNGWTKKYDMDGSLVYQIRYKDDLPVSYSYLDKTGKLVPEIAIPGGSGPVKAYFQNGKLSAEFTYADGKLNGSNTLYHSNGKLRMQGTEDYGLSEGNYKYYHPNGQLQNDYVFLHDNLHGFYKEYNDKGVLTEQGYYYNGEPHDIMKIYEDSGKLKETRFYYYGKLLDVKK